jgi:hypothetical protein
MWDVRCEKGGRKTIEEKWRPSAQGNAVGLDITVEFSYRPISLSAS